MAPRKGEIFCCSLQFYSISVGILGLIGSFAPVARCTADIIVDVNYTPHNASEIQRRKDSIITHSAWMMGFLVYGFSSALLIIAVHQASRTKMIPWLLCSATVDMYLISNALQILINTPQDAGVICVPILYTLVWLGVVSHYRKLRSERVHNAIMSDSRGHNYGAYRGYPSYAMWALPARAHIVLLEDAAALRPAEV